MIEINKRKNDMGLFDIEIKNGETSLFLIFAGTLDLFWALDCKDRKQNSFIITKENYELFSLVEKLYYQVMDCKVFITQDEIGMQINETLNEQLKKSDFMESLIQGNTISWHSDDDLYDEADILNITYENETFIIEFVNQSERFRTFNSAVRFRTSGSRYSYFFVPFMKMFNSLQNYDEDYHQIHIEEYIYSRKLEKNNKIE